jgi:uncharacterized protein YcaQ
MTALRIPNLDARRLWLATNLLSDPPTGPLDLGALIDRLGLVQLDSIQVVARAHHHILWSRRQSYREPMLDRHLRARGVFEHFTHDASVLPMTLLPLWQRQFTPDGGQGAPVQLARPVLDGLDLRPFLDRIARDGPLSTHAFDSDAPRPREMWRRPPHKVGWITCGIAAIWRPATATGSPRSMTWPNGCFPPICARKPCPNRPRSTGCAMRRWTGWALARLGEIRKFWDATEVARSPIGPRATAPRLVPVEMESASGELDQGACRTGYRGAPWPCAPPTSRLRILNPFDPALRDRARLKRLFGFDYTVEMFVPAAKRQWGYYVYPLLEGDRFVGRLETRADRDAGTLRVTACWPEQGVAWTPARRKKLDAELARLARFAALERVGWECAA